MRKSDLIIVVCPQHPYEARSIVNYLYEELGDYPVAALVMVSKELLAYDPMVLEIDAAGRMN